jgi:outer membrane protein
MKACMKDRHRTSVPLSRFAAIILPLAVMGCASGAAHPSAQQPTTRLGVVDLQKVLVETDAGKKARESLNTFMKNRQAVVELEEKDLKRMEEDLIKQASVLSANAKKEREDVLRRRVMEFQQKANDLNREVQEKQKEVLEAFREKAERVVGKVAQQLGLTMVMEKGRGGPTVYSDTSLDISAKVIEEFNKDTGKPEK